MSTADDGLRLAALMLLRDAAAAESDVIRERLKPIITESQMGLAIVLPDGTRVGAVSPVFKGGKSEARISDRAVFLAWCRENQPEVIVTTETVAPWYEAALLARVEPFGDDGLAADPDDGLIVDGVEFKVTPKSASISLRFLKAAKADGRASLLTAIQNGSVPILMAADPPTSPLPRSELQE
jgi:hypothetical protein